MRACLTASIAMISLVACGPSNRDNPGTDAPSQDDAPPSGDGPTASSRVFAHSGGMLYKLNSLTLKEDPIGPMTGLGTQSLTDLAIDKDDHMVGITLDKLYSVDATSGNVTLIKDLSQSARGFTSLSFIPKDLNDPNSADILVSANDQGDVFEIDATTGEATKIGSYGTVALGKVRSSGDLFGVRGFGIYATVDVGTETNDYLAKIDPVTWKATPIGSGTGFAKIFGLGFWGGVIYGFVDEGTGAGGKMIQLDPNTGAGTLLNSSGVRWFGAGVATDAPIIE
jgi:hypothetical protein